MIPCQKNMCIIIEDQEQQIIFSDSLTFGDHAIKNQEFQNKLVHQFQNKILQKKQFKLINKHKEKKDLSLLFKKKEQQDENLTNLLIKDPNIENYDNQIQQNLKQRSKCSNLKKNEIGSQYHVINEPQNLKNNLHKFDQQSIMNAKQRSSSNYIKKNINIPLIKENKELSYKKQINYFSNKQIQSNENYSFINQNQNQTSLQIKLKNEIEFKQNKFQNNDCQIESNEELTPSIINVNRIRPQINLNQINKSLIDANKTDHTIKQDLEKKNKTFQSANNNNHIIKEESLYSCFSQNQIFKQKPNFFKPINVLNQNISNKIIDRLHNQTIQNLKSKQCNNILCDEPDQVSQYQKIQNNLQRMQEIINLVNSQIINNTRIIQKYQTKNLKVINKQEVMIPQLQTDYENLKENDEAPNKQINKLNCKLNYLCDEPVINYKYHNFDLLSQQSFVLNKEPFPSQLLQQLIDQTYLDNNLNELNDQIKMNCNIFRSKQIREKVIQNCQYEKKFLLLLRQQLAIQNKNKIDQINVNLCTINQKIEYLRNKRKFNVNKFLDYIISHLNKLSNNNNIFQISIQLNDFFDQN